MNNLTVIKIGGATLGSHDTAIEDIVTLQEQGNPPVVVHGGGKLITDWLKKQGVETKFVRGERVTDLPTLEVATAVLAGLVNKDIVAAINLHGGRAVGISGVDGSLLEGRVAEPEKGFVGTAAGVQPGVLEALLDAGFVPVVAPIGMYSEGRAEGDPMTLNFNADIAAGEIAAAIGATRLVFLTDVAGIQDEAGKVIPKLTPAEAQALVDSGVASGGMVPKVRACLTSLATAKTAGIIDGRQPHALLKEIEHGGGGTIIGAE